MGNQDLRKQAHDLDVTVWVGKSGIGAVEEELSGQLKNRNLVKVKVLRSARAGTTVEELTEELAERVNADVVETRGNTGVVHR